MPGLSHVPLATPRRELPGWALLVIGVLAAAVLVLGGAWWQSQRSPNAPAASSPAAVTAPVESTPPTAAAATDRASCAGRGADHRHRADHRRRTARAAARGRRRLAAGVRIRRCSRRAAAVARKRRRRAEATRADGRRHYRASPRCSRKASTCRRSGSSCTPYSDNPAERFVFINGRKYKEGERLTEGPEVVTIEPNGVVLSQQGQRFQLAPGVVNARRAAARSTPRRRCADR